MHSWRNWQTRKTKDLVERSMQVHLLLSAPKTERTVYAVLSIFAVQKITRRTNY